MTHQSNESAYPDMDLDPELNHRFDYHAQNDNTINTHIEVRAEIKRLAIILNHMLPEGREKSLTITKLEETQMWAHAAIARNNTEGDTQ